MDIHNKSRIDVYLKIKFITPIILGCLYSYILFFENHKNQIIYYLESFDYFLILISTFIGCFILPIISNRIGIKLSIIISFLSLSSVSFFLNTDQFIISHIFSPIITDFLLISSYGLIVNISDKSNIGTYFGLFSKLIPSILFIGYNYQLINLKGSVLFSQGNQFNSLEYMLTISLIITIFGILSDKINRKYLLLAAFIIGITGVFIISNGSSYYIKNNFIKPSNIFSNVSLMLTILICSISGLLFKENSISLLSSIRFFQSYGTFIALFLIIKFITINY
ncbi:hypothetical protein RB653_005326 [Dictyostelium firmibasis]|uniref:Uncharacterized protein n=1 Tax=Dictyostelium firmibasis TaxID=79012 RepID=A0AAN7UKU5_9MYCE